MTLQLSTQVVPEYHQVVFHDLVQDGLLEVGCEAPFGEVENYRGARTRGPTSPLRFL